jgi:hypothetical protein
MKVADIEARVATILTESEVAINAGSDSGVATGDRVTVYKKVDISDPETDELLGTVHVPIIRLAIISVQPRLSIAEVIELQDIEGQQLNFLTRAQAREKRVVQRSVEAKAGISVYVPVGAPVIISKKPKEKEE